MICKLHADRGHALADAPAIVAMIQSATATSPPLSDTQCAQMAAFAHHARRHLILENAVILPVARAGLTDDDLAVMKRHQLERWGIRPALETE